jgi:flagellar basal body-associated protein FliL
MNNSTFIAILSLLCLSIASCKNDSTCGKYNAQDFSLYSSIEFLPGNFAKLNCNNSNIIFLVKYDQRGKFIYLEFEDRFEGYEILDINTIRGNNGLFDNKYALYKKNFINTDDNDKQLIAILSKKRTDSPVFEYLSCGEITAQTKDKRRIIVSIKIGIAIENLLSAKRELDANMENIRNRIKNYLSRKNRKELSSENEIIVERELLDELTIEMNKTIIKDIVIEEMFIEL